MSAYHLAYQHGLIVVVRLLGAWGWVFCRQDWIWPHDLIFAGVSSLNGLSPAQTLVVSSRQFGNR